MKSVLVYYFLYRKHLIIKKLDKLLLSYLCGISVTKIYDYYLRPGRVIVFTDNIVYKIQLSGKNLDEDVNNREKIFKNSYPANQIEILRDNPKIISCVMLERKEVNIDDVVGLLLLLRKTGQIRECIQNGFPKGIVNGLAVLDYYKISERHKRSIYSILDEICRNEMSIGIVHGDFHSDNILYDKEGKCFLIDFDCAREDDIQAFDAMYYIFEKERKISDMDWLLFWRILWEKEDEMTNKYDSFFDKLIDLSYKDAMIIFLIERIGQEFLLDERHDSSILNSILEDIALDEEHGVCFL